MDKDFLYIVDQLQAPTERGKQRLVGASQLGGCPYHLGVAMLASHDLIEVPAKESGLGAWIGTGVHLNIEHTLNLEGALQEHSVELFEVPGYGMIKGNVDLWWRDRVWDWKVVGKANMSKMRAAYRKQPDRIPTDLYRAQQHLYGFGMQQQGYDVEDVNIVAIPKLSNSFDQIEKFTETYNQELVDKVIERTHMIWEYCMSGDLDKLPRDFEACYDCGSGVTIMRG